DLQPVTALRVERPHDGFRGTQLRAHQARILADGQAAAGAVRRRQQAPLPAAGGRVEGLLGVVGGGVEAIGLDPDLQEVHRLGVGGVVLAVLDPVTCAHPLQFAGPQHAFIAGAVAMGQVAGDDVADDLHVGVAVRGEPATGGHPVFVDHAQRPPAHPPGIVVVAEGKAVPAIEPACADMAALGGRTQDFHGAAIRRKRVARSGKKPAGLGPAGMDQASSLPGALLSASAAGASVVMCSSISSATFGTNRPRPKSLRLIVAFASKPAVGCSVMGCGPIWLRVASSTTSRVMSLMVSSPVTFSLPSPAASTEVLRKVASG